MAASNDEVTEKLARLRVQEGEKTSSLITENSTMATEFKNDVFEPHLSGFDNKDLYRLALSFYKEKEGKAVHLSYEDKLKLVAFTQQVSHGKFSAEKLPDLGVLDVIGRDRRIAWQNLGDMTKEQAMEGFVIFLDKVCPSFKTYVEAQKRDIQEKARLKKEQELQKLEEEKRLQEWNEQKMKEEEERLKQENQRRQIQDALNQQTFSQFKAYAEQQYPGNPEQQGILVRQLQEQHYHQYMQQLFRNQELILEENEKGMKENQHLKALIGESAENLLLTNSEATQEESEEQEDWPKILPPDMWTNANIDEFKNTIRREAGDAVIKIGHGETVTVRVPTHDDGNCLFWEFATDGYDIGFGVYFEWSKPETTQVSVHISESEDDDDEDDYESREDLETGDASETPMSDYKPSSIPISVIIPVYRRDSQEEVYAGSHKYPGQGVYLLKFDNSYSLWRSKTLYYRVYYTRP
ncbi:hypothetical protein TKK_0014150 [Trichogramma kaykai]|uniref:ACB domain-containing protein n=1 Tax=Trichogramma kaykai TaxID=54128 RepID=A0ABD2WFW3_9HYME